MVLAVVVMMVFLVLTVAGGDDGIESAGCVNEMSYCIVDDRTVHRSFQ